MRVFLTVAVSALATLMLAATVLTGAGVWARMGNGGERVVSTECGALAGGTARYCVERREYSEIPFVRQAYRTVTVRPAGSPRSRYLADPFGAGPVSVSWEADGVLLTGQQGLRLRIGRELLETVES